MTIAQSIGLGVGWTAVYGIQLSSPIEKPDAKRDITPPPFASKPLALCRDPC